MSDAQFLAMQIALAVSAWLLLGFLILAFVYCMGYRPTVRGWICGIAFWPLPILAFVAKARGWR